MKKAKLQDLEILRALAIIFIVFIHLVAYLTANIREPISSYASFISHTGLFLFVFVSGFVLYYNYRELESFKDIKRFYSKRAIRIYPLYWFALILAIVWFSPFEKVIINLSSLLVAFLGLQGIFQFSYLGAIWFWFVGVILLYYLIYPILIRSQSLINMFSIAIVVFTILKLIQLKFGFISYNFFLFYWIFFSGIALCWLRVNYKNLTFDLKNSYLEILVLIFALTLFISAQAVTNAPFFPHFENYIVRWLPALSIIAMVSILTYLNNRLGKNFFQSKTYGLIEKISISSYATYLIHPTIFAMIAALWRASAVHNYDRSFLNFIEIGIGIPLVFLLGYYLQKWDLKWSDMISKLYQKYINTV